ncbi:hypothetical protein QKW52_15980 [Bacillus sonorensis]|nr:hypothetical protein [Bacillus sonorensis]
MNRESLLKAFYQEIQGADETSFQKAARSFMNLWDYEYGCLDDLPEQADLADRTDCAREPAFAGLKVKLS